MPWRRRMAQTLEGAKRDAHRGQLTVDPAIAPGRVLPSQAQDDLDGADRNCSVALSGGDRSSGVGPGPDASAAGSRAGRRTAPGAATEKPTQSGEQRPVDGRSAGRATWRRSTATS